MSKHTDPDKNPRLHIRNHRERGPKRYTYTNVDLAKFFDVTIGTINNWISKKILDPTDINKLYELRTSREKVIGPPPIQQAADHTSTLPDTLNTEP